MKLPTRIFSFLFLVGLVVSALAEEPFNGLVLDREMKPKKGVKVYVNDPKRYASTDKKGRFGLTNGSRSTHYDTSYSYDSMGNLTSLTRNGRLDDGTIGKVNQLTYGYDGNRLVSVSDAVIAPSYNGFFGFSDGADKAIEYEYDANGNMTRDRNKGISSITYNVDNLPLSIQYMNGSRAIYRYAADGTKLQVKYATSYGGLLSSGSQGESVSTAIAQTHIIDYVGNRIYEDGRLNKILVDGGYVDYNGGNPVYNAHMTDYQGNIRMVVSESAAVRQAVNYYPYGALMTTGTHVYVHRYMYNGKELDRMHGLDWYDYGARHYDAAIGRWHSMDDMCYAYYDISPYAYCGGDPVNKVDPTGKIIETIWDIGNVLYDVGAAVYHHSTGNHDVAIGNWLDAGLDAAAVIIPGLPAGVSKIAKNGANAIHTIDKATDINKSLDTVSEIATKTVGKSKNADSAKEAIKIGRSGRQARLKELGEDPKLGKADRAWIKQEQRLIQQGKRKNIRNPKGKVLAHPRGKEAAKGYSYKDSQLQLDSNHKLQHKHDNNGKKNKQNSTD